MNSIHNYEFEVTDRLEEVIRRVKSDDEATAWLESLPGLVERYRSTWDLTLIGVPDSGAMSCCVFALYQGKPAVLKIPFDKQSGIKETAVISRWGDNGASPEVYEYDGETGVFLMERIIPGDIAEPSDSINDSHMVVDLLDKLHSSSFDDVTNVVGSYREVVDLRYRWARDSFIDAGSLSGLILLESAYELVTSTDVSSSKEVVNHGDFQPKNILVSDDGNIKTIDPLACFGFPEFDASFWACNQLSSTSIDKRLRELEVLGRYNYRILHNFAVFFCIAEMNPRRKKYSKRMIDYLKEIKNEELDDILGRSKVEHLVDMITNDGSYIV